MLKTGTDKENTAPRRKRGVNIYDRLEEARAQRAKILATPDAANRPNPIGRKVTPNRVVPEKTSDQNKPSGQKRLPHLEPASSDIVPEADPPPETEDTPLRKDSILMWLVAGLIVAMLLLAYSWPAAAPETPVTVSTETSSIAAPDTPGGAVVVPSATSELNQQSPSDLAIATPDIVPERPLLQLAPTPDVQTDVPRALPVISDERPRPSPRVDAPVERGLPSDLTVTAIEEESFVAPDLAAQPLTIRPSVNLPRTVSNVTARNVASTLEALGLEAVAPKYFSFNVRQTQVRYFHDGDRIEAQQLAEALDATLRDFTNFQPQPPEGRVELWVAGRSAAPRRSTTNTSVLDGVGRDLRQIGNDLQSALRSISGR